MHELTRAALRIIDCLADDPFDPEATEKALVDFAAADSSAAQLELAALLPPERVYEVVEHPVAGKIVIGGPSMPMLPDGYEVISDHHYVAEAAEYVLSGKGSLFNDVDFDTYRARIIREGVALRAMERKTETLGDTANPWSRSADARGASSRERVPKPPTSAGEARRKAEGYIKHHDFPGLNALARQCGCSPTTMRKAIGLSEQLQRAQAAHELAQPKADRRPRAAADASWNAQVDEALRQLIEYSTVSERARLNDPAVRAHLLSMDPTALGELVGSTREQHARRSSSGHRKQGVRSPVRAHVRAQVTGG